MSVASNPYSYQMQAAKKEEKIDKHFIRLNEKVARDKMSTMIGEKIIGKIFTDNLKDFEETKEQDMEPILNICSIITKVLMILKELDVK